MPAPRVSPWRRRWSAKGLWREGRFVRHLLRAEDDPPLLPGHPLPDTRDELKDLLCLGFSAEPGNAVLLTPAYPKAHRRDHAPHPA